MLIFIIKLLLANLMGDFLLQPSILVKKKMESIYYTAIHIAIYTVSLLLVLRFDFSYWSGILILVSTHFIIDFFKIKLTGNLNERLLFFADQLFHMLVIALVVYIYYPYRIDMEWLYSENTLIIFTALVFITTVSSILVKTVMSRWDIKEDSALKNAGVYIGILERLFIFGFILLDYWEGIGFLLAAKSVFRFGDLSKSKDRKLTEYMLIGTLLSFGIAIGSGIICQYLMKVLIQ